MMQLISHNKFLSKTLGFLFLLFLSVPTIANNLSSHQLYKGVIIDVNDDIAYVINPNGGIDSISIQTGLQLWHFDNADYPLLVKDSQLIAHVDNSEAGKISLVALDANTGEVTQIRQITIPDHIYAKVSHGINQQFDINIDPDNPFSGKIQWQFKAKTAQGMLPEPELRLEEKLNYGEISLSDIDSSLSTAKTKLLQQKPIKKIAAIEGKFIGNVDGRQFKSISEEHILVSKLKSDTSVWNKYYWEILDLDGNLLGALDNNVSYNAFLISGDILIYVSSPYARYKQSGTIKGPLSIHAFSLTSGNHLWNKEIRDLKFQGQVPH